MTNDAAVAWVVVVDGVADYANVHKWACESEASIYGTGPQVTVEPLYSATTVAELRAEVERLRETLTAIRQYGSDTLSGRADGGADDREWQRDAVREMTKRARVGLGIKLPGEE